MKSNRHYLQILGIAFVAETHTLSCRHQNRQQHNSFNKHNTNNNKNNNNNRNNTNSIILY